MALAFFQTLFAQAGPWGSELFVSAIGGLLPIALCAVLHFDVAVVRILIENPNGIAIPDLVAEVGKAPELIDAPAGACRSGPWCRMIIKSTSPSQLS